MASKKSQKKRGTAGNGPQEKSVEKKSIENFENVTFLRSPITCTITLLKVIFKI